MIPLVPEIVDWVVPHLIQRTFGASFAELIGNPGRSRIFQA